MRQNSYFIFKLQIMQLVLLLLSSGVVLLAQDSELLSHSSQYIHGISENKDLETARRQATNTLLNQIQVTVSSILKSRTIEDSKSINEFSELTQESVSFLDLPNLQEKVIKTKNGYKVYKFIERSEVDRFFELRKGKIKEYMKFAKQHELQLDVFSALRNYYYAFLLSKSYPDTIIYVLPDMESPINYPAVGIHNKINQILNDVNISIDGCEASNELLLLYMFATFKGQPIKKLAVTYYNGLGNELTYAENGKLTVVLYQNPVSTSMPFSANIIYFADADLENEPGLLQLHKYYQSHIFDNSKLINIDLSPFAKIDFEATFQHQTVQFKPRLAVISATNFRWDFGDGGISSNAEPIHRYKQKSLYTVTLQLNDNEKLRIQKTIDLYSENLSDIVEDNTRNEVVREAELKSEQEEGKPIKPVEMPQVADSSLIDRLLAIKDVDKLEKFLVEEHQNGMLQFGNREDFYTSEGKYVVVFDSEKLYCVLKCQGGYFEHQESGQRLADLTAFKGKKQVWLLIY